MTSCSQRRLSETDDGDSVRSNLNAFYIDQKLHGSTTSRSKKDHLKNGKTGRKHTAKAIAGKQKATTPIFEDFPRSVFDRICTNISMNDVLALSMTCSKIKNKVEYRIYKHMRIVDIDHIIDEDEIIIQKHFGDFKDESLENESWWVYNNISNIGTAKSILHLVYNILTNPARGKYLKTIEINPVLKPSPWQRRNDDYSNNKNSIWNKTLDNFLSIEELAFIKTKFSFFDSNLTLFDCLLLLLDKTVNLEKLLVSRFALPQVSQLLLKTSNLKELKIMVYENDKFVKLPLNNLRNLEVLRIKFQENTEDILENISNNFNEYNILSNLKTLQLKYDKTDFNYLTNTTWFSFFKPLLNSPKLFKNLKKLVLKDCFMGSDSKSITSKLSYLIPLEQLESLYLQIYEYSHKNMKHSESELNSSCNHQNTSLSYLSPQLKNIEKIILKPTKNCKDCQINSVLHFLKAHQKLKYIWLSTDSLNKENYNKVLSILNSYKHLEKLAYFDEFINMKLINNLKNWFIFQHSILEFDIFKHYESESLRQDVDPLFDCYIIDEFKNFNENERNLLVLFWQQFLNDFKLHQLMRLHSNGAVELKLFGYNFKVDKHRKVILLYISKVVGYVDLIYYH